MAPFVLGWMDLMSMLKKEMSIMTDALVWKNEWENPRKPTF